MKKKSFPKELILSNAIELAKSVGFKKLTMRKLAERVGSSVMPIYTIYESKEDLLQDIYQHIVVDLISIENYFKRNNEVLIQGIKSPAFYRDMRDFNPVSDNVEAMYQDTIALMKREPKLKHFNEQELSSLHFDISVYITGIVERQLNKRQHFDNYKLFCINTLYQFTEILIRGYNQVSKEEK